jgi:hypothetical protein
MWIWAVAIGAGAIGHVLLAWSHRHLEAWLGSLITNTRDAKRHREPTIPPD